MRRRAYADPHLRLSALLPDLEPVREESGKQVTLVRVATQLPAGFPEKYRSPMERAIDHCAVKKHIVDPPRFELTLQ